MHPRSDQCDPSLSSQDEDRRALACFTAAASGYFPSSEKRENQTQHQQKINFHSELMNHIMNSIPTYLRFNNPTPPELSSTTSNMSERKRLTRIFKMHGLSLQASALDTLLDVVQREAEVGRNKADVNNVIFNIIDEIKDRRIQGGNGSGGRSSSVGNIVTSALLEDVVADFRRDAKDVSDDAVQLLDAFHMPRLDFDRMRKNFTLVPFGKEERTLYGDAVAKVSCSVV